MMFSVRFAFLFPRFKMLSGAERLILKLAEALSGLGHDIHILSHQFDATCVPLMSDRVKLHLSGVPMDRFQNRYVNAALDYLHNGKLVDLIPDAADAICCFGPALTAASGIRRKTGSPVLYFCYEPPRFLYTDREVIRQRMGPARVLSGPAFALYKRKDQTLVKSVDAVLSNSHFGSSQIREIYGRDASVITHGLDPHRPGTRRDEIRNRVGLTDQHVGVVTVNYLHPRKRIELFLETVRMANAKIPAVRGVVVGGGPELERLQRLANGVAHFTGFVPEDQLFEYYQAADIYLHTGRLETFGLSVIEGAGNGLPLVSVNEGGPRETIQDGKTGFLRHADPGALADAILTLTADPDARNAMGRHGYEYVRNKYSWTRGAEDFLRVSAGVQRDKPAHAG